jgi:AcrR family transcriptional regulator
MRTEKLGTAVRQEQIAQAALSLIASHGVKGLSVAAVARRVGLVPSAIYRHFKGKDEILDAALGFIAERLLGNVKAVAHDAADPLERLRLLLMLHVQMIRENQGIPRIIFSEDAYSGHPERKAKVLRMIRTYLDAIAGIVRQGQRCKRIRRDLEPPTVALMFLGMIQPAAILWHLSDGAFDVTKHTEKAWKIFSEAIGTE